MKLWAQIFLFDWNLGRIGESQIQKELVKDEGRANSLFVTGKHMFNTQITNNLKIGLKRISNLS